MQWLADVLLVVLSPAGLAAMAAIAAGLLFPRLLSRSFRRAERLLSRFARRAPLLLPAAIAVVLYAGAGVIRMPEPVIHDEFSNLLAADTFAHGRLANPPHPQWRHFENFHVLQRPSYASKFPPGTGAALAAGMLLGHPIFGMWLVVAACAAAISRALRAWLPAPWAVLGSLMVVTHTLVFTWGHSYWGGAVALLGSALFIGGFVHAARSNAAPFAAAAGLAVLLCSRPYEGVALAVATVVVYGREAIAWKRLSIASVAILLPALAFLAYDNWRVTGDPRVLPYVLYEREYNPAPLFVWDEPRAVPAGLPADMRTEYTNRLARAQGQRTLAGWLRESGEKSRLIVEDLFTLAPDAVRWWPAFVLLALPFVLARRRAVRRATAIAALTLAAILCVIWYIPYYLAVLFPPGALVWITCLRHVRAARIARRRSGLLWSRILVIAWLAAFALQLRVWQRVPPIWQGATDRARVARDLERLPGRDLVLVEYGPRHFIHVSWTYNGADLQNAPVVWARSLSPEEDRALMNACADRNVWLIRPDESTRLVRVRAAPTRPSRP